MIGCAVQDSILRQGGGGVKGQHGLICCAGHHLKTVCGGRGGVEGQH
jgi:hypothetical protein